jgi:hypothetical protein
MTPAEGGDMSAIPATQRKLQHARETFQLLQTSAHHIPLEREEVERRLSDFLSAAYSVEDVLKDDIKLTRGKRCANSWVDSWWGKPPPRQAFHTFMRNQRVAELHHQGATIRTTLQEIPYADYLRRNKYMQSGRSGGYFHGPQWTGPYGEEIPRTPVPIAILMLGDEDVAEACARYLSLLEQMVQAYLATHHTS